MRKKNSEILDLNIFLTVLDLGSFHKAAEVLSLSQPALTRRIQALEETFGAKLLERNTRNVSATRAGMELEPGFRRIVREFDDCVFSLGDLGVKPSGVLTIAAIPTVASAFLPHVLTRFRAIYPDIDLRIRDVSPPEGLESVARGEAEFGINSMGASRPELKFTPLLDDPFAIACRRDHPLAREKRVRWHDLVHYPLIVSQRSNNRIVVDQALARSKLTLNWAFQVGHLATSFGLVEAGLGISVVPRLSRALEEHPAVAIVPLYDPVVTRTIGIIERRGRQLSRSARTLLQLILDGRKEWTRVLTEPAKSGHKPRRRSAATSA
jgi:DNA-binding transcriptional LysR family regulator